MDVSLLWIGVLPVVIFVILDAFTNKKAAILSAIAFAVAESVFSLIKFGAIDELTVLSLVLVVFFGFLSIKKNNDLYFKLQGPILNVFFAVVLFFFYWILHKPLFNFMLEKYFGDFMVMFDQRGISREAVMRLMNGLSRDLGYWLLFHSLITAFAALRLSKWWWFFFRVPFFYAMLFIAMR